MTNEIKALRINEDTYPIYLEWVSEVSRLELNTLQGQILVIDPELFQGNRIIDQDRFDSLYAWAGAESTTDFEPIDNIVPEMPVIPPVVEAEPIPEPIGTTTFSVEDLENNTSEE